MGIFSDLALNVTVGDMREEQRMEQLERVWAARPSPAERRAAMQADEKRRREEIEQFAAAGRLCGHCREFETSSDGFCALCLDLRQRRQQEREQERAASVVYIAQAEAAGIVVGAQVRRKAGSAMGTVVEVLGNAVRVSWRQHQREACPSWCNGRHHRSYIKALSSLVVVN
jgi:hypothetical protein